MTLREYLIRNPAPSGKVQRYWDTQRLDGARLGLRVSAKGKGVYVIRRTGSGRDESLADADGLRLQDARALARDAVAPTIDLDAHIASGPDIAAGEGMRAAVARAFRPDRTPTVDEAYRRYCDTYQAGRVKRGEIRATTVRDYRYQFNKHVSPAIGAALVRSVSASDCRGIVADLGKVVHNRVLANLSAFFAWCVDQGYRADNPAQGIKRPSEGWRKRVITDAEFRAFMLAMERAEAHHPAVVAALRFNIESPRRIREVLTLRWEHVDWDAGRIFIRPKRHDEGQYHGLTPAALDILRERPRDNDWCFTTGGPRRAALGYSHTRKVFQAIVTDAGLSDLRLHDLRHHGAWQLAAQGESAFVIRDALGHDNTTMANRYVGAQTQRATDALTRASEARREVLRDTGNRPTQST